MPVEDAFRARASSFKDAHSSLPVRWIPPENLHVTLVPPWYCEKVEDVCRGLHGLLEDVRAFEVSFGRISVGPTKRNPRLIWASGGVHSGLGKLQEKLSHLAEPLPDKSGRAFLLHVTLARIRKGVKVELPSEVIDWKVRLGSVCLYESILRSTGAEYRELCRVGLGCK